ncbi:tail assembly chaperone [Microbacterium Phage DejaVu]|nr:tail assembly chaperone [Microbacterium phage Lupine]QIG58595.1 tail assembly chaperone [Microbacterium phage Hubbs]WNM66183.1 tail assembly chaperone [Microbacterium Phage DejaVu]
MSEEIETIKDGDIVVPAPADFNMFDALEGVEYPEDEVTVALNEKAAHRLANLMGEIHRYQVDHPAPEDRDPQVIADLAKRVESIKKDIEKSRITFYLKGIPDDVLTTAADVAEEKFEEVKKDAIDAQGNPIKVLPQSEKIRFMRYMNAVTYSMFIQRFVRHSDKAVRTTPTPDEIAAFMDKAPEAAKGKLVSKIQELRVRSEDYEATLDEGFFSEVLSLPSHAWMKPIIQAAVDSGRPPLELLLNQPDRKRSKLDGILIKALYLNKAYEIEGYPIWIEESPDIHFKAVPRVIRSLQVVEIEQERESKKDNPTKGKRFHAEAVLRPGATWPTRSDWEKRHKSGEVIPEEGVTVRQNKIAKDAEARAAAKVAQDPEVQKVLAEFEEKRKRRTGSMGE